MNYPILRSLKGLCPKFIYSVLMVGLCLLYVKPTNAQTKIGVLAGMNFSNVKLKSETGHYTDSQPLKNFRVGLYVQVPLIKDFSVEPALLYSEKGFKQKSSSFSGANNPLKVEASYIELPVNALYKTKLGIGHLLLTAGPYVAYGLGGKWKSENPVLLGDILIEGHGDVIFKKDIMDGEWGNYNYGKPWDYGLNFAVGYEFMDQLSLVFQKQIGLNNLEPKYQGKALSASQIKNQGFNISLKYTFK